jgi:hypothetical protein
MTLKTSLPRSPSEQSNDSEKSSLKTILKDVKKADAVKNVVKDLAGGHGLSGEKLALTALKLIKNSSVNSIDNKTSPRDIFEYLKTKIDLRDSPSIEYIAHKINLTDSTRNKVQAVLTVVETDMASQDMFVFEKVGEAFNNRVPRFDHHLPLSVGECAFTVQQMNKISEKDFSEEVCLYIAACAHEAGFLCLPTSLRFCQAYLEKFTGITDVKQIYDKYEKMDYKTPSGDDLVDRQVEKMSAVDAYLGMGANV